uniref:Uncharacterized protein n=1 Tax=Leptobrachium leishanense TaxID=445787 RepID=A0A8C5QM86_9ANUR
MSLFVQAQTLCTLEVTGHESGIAPVTRFFPLLSHLLDDEAILLQSRSCGQTTEVLG